MTLNRFFLLFLAVSLFIYFILEPYVIDQKKLKDIPILEFDAFVTYEIEGNELKVMLMGEKMERYPNRFELEDFALYREANNTVQTISAKSGMYRKNRIYLEKDVQYHGKDNLYLITDKATYNIKHETLDIRTPFKLSQQGSVIEGSSLFFNQKDDKIKANDVKTSIQLK